MTFILFDLKIITALLRMSAVVATKTSK